MTKTSTTDSTHFTTTTTRKGYPSGGFYHFSRSSTSNTSNNNQPSWRSNNGNNIHKGSEYFKQFPQQRHPQHQQQHSASTLLKDSVLRGVVGVTAYDGIQHNRYHHLLRSYTTNAAAAVAAVSPQLIQLPSSFHVHHHLMHNIEHEHIRSNNDNDNDDYNNNAINISNKQNSSNNNERPVITIYASNSNNNNNIGAVGPTTAGTGFRFEFGGSGIASSSPLMNQQQHTAIVAASPKENASRDARKEYQNDVANSVGHVNDAGWKNKLLIGFIGSVAKAFMCYANNTRIYDGDKLFYYLEDANRMAPVEEEDDDYGSDSNNNSNGEGGDGSTEKATRRMRKRGLLTVSNHISTIDDPFIFAAMFPWHVIWDPTRIKYTLCAEDICFRNKFFASLAYTARVLPITRGAGIEQKHIYVAIEKLKEGNWLHMFPEGKVSATGELLPLRKGGVGKLLEESDECILVPIFHKGLEKVKPYKKITTPKIFKDVDIIVGDPVPYMDLKRRLKHGEITREQFYSEVAERIERALRHLDERLAYIRQQQQQDQDPEELEEVEIDRNNNDNNNSDNGRQDGGSSY